MGLAVAVDSFGSAYVAGTTKSADFPTMNPLFPFNNGDAFVTVFVAGPLIAPLDLIFGDGTLAIPSPPQTATLTNTSDVALTFNVIYIEGPDAGDFSQTNDCPKTLAVGGSCTITVTFTATALNERTAAVAFSDNGPITRQTLPLSGIGVLPAVTFSPTSLAFPNQSLFTASTAQNVTLENTGPGILAIGSTAMSGPFAETNTCRATLNGYGSCTISVTFTPTANGTATGVLSVTDNAPGGTQTVPLSGVGVSPAVALSPASLTFVDQTVYTISPTQQATLTNTGTGAAILALDGIVATGPFTQTNNCAARLNPGASCTVTVSFKPTVAGLQTGSVAFTDNAPGSPQGLPLTGTGTYIQFSPASWAFGTQPVHTSGLPKKFAVTNKGPVTVTISKVSIAGADPEDFSQTNTCTALASGASCFVTVTFTPTVTGQRSAGILIFDNGGGSPQSALLTGAGT